MGPSNHDSFLFYFFKDINMKITNYTLIPRDAKNSPLLSTIFLHLVIWYILDIFVALNKRERLLSINLVNFLEKFPTLLKIFKNSKFSKCSKIQNSKNFQ